MNTHSRVHVITVEKASAPSCVHVYIQPSDVDDGSPLRPGHRGVRGKTKSRAVPEVFRNVARVKIQSSCVVSPLHTCLLACIAVVILRTPISPHTTIVGAKRCALHGFGTKLRSTTIETRRRERDTDDAGYCGGRWSR